MQGTRFLWLLGLALIPGAALAQPVGFEDYWDTNTEMVTGTTEGQFISTQ